MVPCHFFREISANRRNTFFVENTYSAILTWQKLKNKVNRSHSDIKQHPYWLSAGKKLMSGQSIISIIFTNLGPFGAYSVITFSTSFSIRWYASIVQKLHRFPGNQRFEKSIVVNSLFKSRHIFVLSTHLVNRSTMWPSG